MHVLEAGEGRPLLLLHGGTFTASSSWPELLPVLAERYHVVAPDSRGHGRTVNPSGGLSDQEEGRHTPGLIRELDPPAPLGMGYNDRGKNFPVVPLRPPKPAGGARPP